MRKIFSKSLLAILTFCLVLMLVACDPVEPIDNAKTAEEWGIDVNYTERKPFALSNPDNPYDQKSEMNFAEDVELNVGTGGAYFSVELINTESINNLFYDYTLADFGIEYSEMSSEDSTYYSVNSERAIHDGSQIEQIRSQLRNGDKVDLSRFNRIVNVDITWEDSHGDAREGYNLLMRLVSIDFVRNVEIKNYGWMTTTPSGYDANNTWWLESMDVREAWDYTVGSPNVTVGIIDSGVFSNHSALNHAHNSDLDRYDEDDSACGADTYGHGTKVAGVMFAEDSSEGVYGICYGAKYASLKGCVDNNSEDIDIVTQMIADTNASQIPILNFSGGFKSDQVSTAQRDSLFAAIQGYQGLIVVAAGNHSKNIENELTLYPQNFNLPNILVVGASTEANGKAGFSNYGSENVDLFAPGDDIYTTTNDGSYDGISGTSMSAPFVAGVAALLKSYKPSLTTAQIKEAIMNSVTPVSGLSGLCVSGGILNAQAALEYVCDHVYGEECVYIDENGHSVVCTLCGDVKIESHNSKYTANNSTTHKLSCACGHVEKEAEAHFFIYVGLHGVMQKFECQMCGFTKLENIDVPIVRPDEIIRPIGEFVSDE